jgi:hypothetical protein
VAVSTPDDERLREIARELREASKPRLFTIENRVIWPFKVLVCGSRNWTERTLIRLHLASFVMYDTDEQTCIHGHAPGADQIAGEIALDLGYWVEPHPANWRKYGKKAGPIRNREMLDRQPDVVLAFQKGASRGTQDTIDEARCRGIPVRVVSVQDDYTKARVREHAS